MDNFSTDLHEIGAQHEALLNTLASLQGILMQPDQQHLIRPVLSDLHRLLMVHYAYEESLMDMAGCQDLGRHKRMSDETRRLFDYFFLYPSSLTGDIRFANSVIWKVLGHVADSDAHEEIQDCHTSLVSAAEERKVN